MVLAMRTRSIRIAGAWLLAMVAACSSSHGPSPSDISTACTHICMCETGMTDTTCQSRCSMGSGTASFSSFSNSLSASFSLASATQACIDCINAATCNELTSDIVCNTECQ